MNKYECERFKCFAKVMPAIRPYWTQPRQEFEGFINRHMPRATFTVENKRLIIQNCSKMYCIGSGNYFVFRSDGERLVMGPTSFRSIFVANI